MIQEEAFHVIVRFARENRRGPWPSYGYDVWIPNVIADFLHEVRGVNEHQAGPEINSLSPVFYAAAWDLCRRGIFRPGIKQRGEQIVEQGAAGDGYSVTPAGHDWLKGAADYESTPIEPGRFARMLDGFSPRFGDGYAERAREAVACYRVLTYVACCALCGAAAESILLAAAIAKTNDEPKVLTEYARSGGRAKIENLIFGQQPEPIRRRYMGFAILLNYWRDAAAHGRRSGINDKEAFTALALLLGLAQFVDEHWAVLT
jgi:hypothetical protein